MPEHIKDAWDSVVLGFINNFDFAQQHKTMHWESETGEKVKKKEEARIKLQLKRLL